MRPASLRVATPFGAPLAVEVSPALGTLLAFRRSDGSWHGHTPYVGQRRVLQLNYLTSAKDSMASALRHRLSALSKRLVA